MQGVVQQGIVRLLRATREMWLRRPSAFNAEWNRKDRGNWGESWAEWYYFHKRGAAIIARNWRGGGGEIDLIVREGETLVFVEVKTRDASDPEPLAQVRDEKRRRHFQSAAAAYRRLVGRPRPILRFDALVVTPNPEAPCDPQIDCLPAVFGAAEFEEPDAPI